MVKVVLLVIAFLLVMLNAVNTSWICMTCGRVVYKSNTESPDPNGCKAKYDGQHIWVEVVGIK